MNLTRKEKISFGLGCLELASISLILMLGICIILLMLCYHLDAWYPQVEKDLSEGRMENGQPI